jgi:anti-sigma factor RsiW
VSAEVCPFRAPVTDDELHAYVDGEVGERRARQIEAYLADHADAGTHVHAYLRQRAMLRELFRQDAAECRPAEMFDAARLGQSALRRWFSRWPPPRLAACVALFLVAGTLGWSQQTRSTNEPPAIGKLTETGVGGAVIAFGAAGNWHAEAEPELVGFQPSELSAEMRGAAPDFEGFGFRLAAVHSPPINGAPARQLVYRSESGKSVSLFSAESRFDLQMALAFLTMGDAPLFYWSAGGTGYALTGEVERDELLAMARKVTSSATAAREAAAPTPARRRPKPRRRVAERRR